MSKEFLKKSKSVIRARSVQINEEQTERLPQEVDPRHLRRSEGPTRSNFPERDEQRPTSSPLHLSRYAAFWNPEVMLQKTDTEYQRVSLEDMQDYMNIFVNSRLKLELMKKYQSDVETKLQPQKPIWEESNGHILRIELNRHSTREDGLKLSKKLLSDIYEEMIELSPEMLKRANQIIGEETPNAIVDLDLMNKRLAIATFGKDTLLEFKKMLTSMDSEEKYIKDKLKKNVMQESGFSLEKTQVDYLKKEKMKDSDDVCQKSGTDNPVTITVGSDNQLHNIASTENMDEAKPFIGGVTKEHEKIGQYFGVETDRKEGSASVEDVELIFKMKYDFKFINIYKANITEIHVDAIVKVVTKDMGYDSGVTKAIIGDGQVIQPNVFIETVENLHYKYIIHVVGLVWTIGTTKEKLELTKAVKKSLVFANSKTITNIIFPAICPGDDQYSIKGSMGVLASNVKTYLDKNPETSLTTIIFVDPRKDVVEKFKPLIEKVFKTEIRSENKVPSKPAVSSSTASISRTASSSKPPSPPSTSVPQNPLLKPQQSRVTKSLIIISGRLQDITADIIVNSISNDMDFSKGKLSTAIGEQAGSEMINDCLNYEILSIFQIIITKGYRLHCDKVFHISVPFCRENASLIIRKYMEKCLAAADQSKATSIALPCIGTGQTEYPIAVVAETMLRAAYDHLNRTSSCLKEVYIIVYQSDTDMFKEFQYRLNTLGENLQIQITNDRGSHKLTIDVNKEDTVNMASIQTGLKLSAQGVPTGGRTSADFLLGDVSIFLICGDLLAQKTDAIVHCTDAEFNLEGPISKYLCKTIGDAFTKDCKSKVSVINKKHFAVMDAYCLDCEMILHLDIVTKLLEPEKILLTCFSAVKRYRIATLSIPMLATAGRSVPLDKMAEAMVNVISVLRIITLKRINVVFQDPKMIESLKKEISKAKEKKR